MLFRSDLRVYNDENTLQATLIEGKIKVSSETQNTVLMPGWQAKIDANGRIQKEEVDTYPFIAWKNGRIFFDNQRLEDIITELQRWYDFTAIYENQDLKNQRYTLDVIKYEGKGGRK